MKVFLRFLYSQACSLGYETRAEVDRLEIGIGYPNYNGRVNFACLVLLIIHQFEEMVCQRLIPHDVRHIKANLPPSHFAGSVLDYEQLQQIPSIR